MAHSFIKFVKSISMLILLVGNTLSVNSQEIAYYKHHLISINSVYGRYGENTMTTENLVENNSLRGINFAYTYRIKPRIGFHINYSRLKCPFITDSRSIHTVIGIKLTTKANKRLQFFVLPVIGIGKYQTWNRTYSNGIEQFKFKNDYRNIDVGLSLGFDIHVSKFMFLCFQANIRTSAQRFNGYSNMSFGFGLKL
jgi:hypothetical protein